MSSRVPADGRLQRVQRDAVCGCHPTSAVQVLRAASPPANTGGDPLTSAHMRNWMECVRARKDPHAPVEAGYGHTVALVMSNAALRTGMRATFDEKGRQVLAGGKPWTGYKSIHDGNWFTNLF